ncbi:hypothetical protein G1J88_11365 [Tenacibaculum dicentrarchi]|nr:hypothetical protein [Tenacibaculum dicentrarchi]
MKKPILLIRKELILPIEQALERIEKIRQRKVNNVDSIILEGLFTLGISSFEHSLIDTLRTLFTHIPDKLDLKTESITKDELINGEPLRKTIENKVNSVSYKNISEILKYFADITEIPNNLISELELNSLIELKATRNLLIHNNLKINSIYEDTAGPNSRVNESYNGQLNITQDYLFESIVILKGILQKFKNELLIKYKSFTKVKATENLFKYIFPTPILHFEDVFEINKDEDKVGNLKSNEDYKIGISGSETFLLGMWIAHSHQRAFDFNAQYFYRLDKNNRAKFGFLINNIDLLRQ